MSKSISPETIIGHYRVVSQIGEGGMGEVYQAEDSRLHRKVALKILPSEMAANQDRMRRFKQEAMAAAALNHPNISHIYEIGEHDGTNFIAMEFVEGVTLRDKIHRERTELRRLLRYLQHVAEGLAKAHGSGIVHRDLKPDNIMITHDGHAKVLDFGLAKLIEPQQPRGIANASTGEDATAILQQQSTPGMIMGTIGYMSPEQAQGKTNEIDQRSDIFSFGCILFEAVTGKKPFEGDSIVKSLHSLIYEPAPQVKDLNPSAPADLQRIIRRCLAKDKEERYQTIKDVAIELKELRRELETSAASDTTVLPPVSNEGARSTESGSTIESTAVSSASLPPSVSSAEFLAQGLKRHRLVVVIALVILIGAVALFVYYLNAGTIDARTDSIAVLPFENRSGNADTDYLDLEPDFILGRYLLGLTYNANGMYQEAITLAEKPLQADPTNQLMLHVSGYAYAKSGRRNEANAIISRFKEISKTQYVISFYVATIYAGLGEDEKAFAELQTAFQERDWRMSALLKVEPMLDPLRDDPRYKDLLKRMGLPD